MHHYYFGGATSVQVPKQLCNQNRLFVQRYKQSQPKPKNKKRVSDQKRKKWNKKKETMKKKKKKKSKAFKASF